MTSFELIRLLDYEDDSILRELQRVATLIDTPIITIKAFDGLSRVDSTTVRKRFGGWRNALLKAGLSHRYSGAVVTERMRRQCSERHTDEELINELKRVANDLNSETFTAKQFDNIASIHSATIVRHFGSWAASLIKAGLKPGRGARRYTEDDYFENILNVWTHYGRQPKYVEMDMPPSFISSGAYEAKWGKWTNALRDFLNRMEIDTIDSRASNNSNIEEYELKPSILISEDIPQGRRPIKLGVRYDVLKRDRFRCVICGASPAIAPDCQLHVDHIIPVTKGGSTMIENLRSLCSNCNIGKGAKIEKNS